MQPYSGIRPKHAELWAANQERVAKIILPPKTKTETAQKAVQQAVQKWVEALDRKQHLQLVSSIDIEGPFFCPFLETYGDDMWLAKGHFRATKPRRVPEDLVVANRRLSEDGKLRYEYWRTAPEKAMPDDYREQFGFVKQNAEKVYDDLRSLKKEIPDDYKEALDA